MHEIAPPNSMTLVKDEKEGSHLRNAESLKRTMVALINEKNTGRLSVSSQTARWELFFKGGNLEYASISTQTRSQLFFTLRTIGEQGLSGAQVLSKIPLEIKKVDALIVQLTRQQAIGADFASKLVLDLTKEALETLLWLEEASYHWTPEAINATFTASPDIKLPNLDLSTEMEAFRLRLLQWQKLRTVVDSPYVRPYIFDYNGILQKQVETGKLSYKLHKNLTKLLKGFSLRQLGPLMGQDELKVALFLLPYIREGVIVLREPETPFDLLPEIPLPNGTSSRKAINIPSKTQPRKIACIDDSPTILDEMHRLLGGEGFEVTKIDDPIKASSALFRIKPDLILLDVTMPEINGYKLCDMLRSSVLFKDTPIVMVTGNRSLIDKARAKISGATDYLTKPFTKDSLLGMVNKYVGHNS